MNRIRRRSLILLAPALAIASLCFAAADDEKPAAKPPTDHVGRLRFTPPAGWEKTEKNGIAILNPKDVKPTECSIVLVSGEQLKGDFLQWFKRKWLAFQKDLDILEGGERTTQDGPNGSEVLYETALLGKDKQPQAGVLLWSAHAGSGVDWVLFQANSVETFNKHKPEVVKLLAGIRLGGAATPAKPKPTPPAKSWLLECH